MIEQGLEYRYCINSELYIPRFHIPSHVFKLAFISFLSLEADSNSCLIQGVISILMLQGYQGLIYFPYFYSIIFCFGCIPLTSYSRPVGEETTFHKKST